MGPGRAPPRCPRRCRAGRPARGAALHRTRHRCARRPSSPANHPRHRSPSPLGRSPSPRPPPRWRPTAAPRPRRSRSPARPRMCRGPAAGAGAPRTVTPMRRAKAGRAREERLAGAQVPRPCPPRCRAAAAPGRRRAMHQRRQQQRFPGSRNAQHQALAQHARPRHLRRRQWIQPVLALLLGDAGQVHDGFAGVGVLLVTLLHDQVQARRRGGAVQGSSGAGVVDVVAGRQSIRLGSSRGDGLRQSHRLP